MAKNVTLPGSTQVTVVSRLEKRKVVKNMTYQEALYLKSSSSPWTHTIYQLGFTSEKTNYFPIPIPPPPK